MRAVVGLVLALQAMGELGGEPAEGFPFGINDVPVAADLGLEIWRMW